MKKIRSLVVPLLVIPFLASCGSKKLTQQYKVEASIFYNNGGTRETAGVAEVKGTPKAGEKISVKLSTSGNKYALPQPVNENLPDAIKLTSDGGSIDYNNVKYTFNSDANANLNFVMPAGNVTLEVEVTLKQQHAVSSTITGATTTIKVEGKTSSTAYAGDRVEITAAVDWSHKLPFTPDKACELITSSDITLTRDNFNIDTYKREIIISFAMPNKAVSVTGEIELMDYSILCDVRGATSTIKVNGQEASTAYVNDNVEITVSIKTGYILPTTKEEAKELITSEGIVLTEDNFEIDASNHKIIISFTMPDNAVSVTGEFGMTDFNLSCNVTGASRTLIAVEDEEASTAHYGDFVQIGIWVAFEQYIIPSTKEGVLEKINSDDVTLTTGNVEFSGGGDLIIISFDMPGNDVELTGGFDEKPTYNVSCSVTGASQTVIFVNTIETNVAHAGDAIEVGIVVADGYAMPSTKEEILEKVNSSDVALTTDNVFFVQGVDRAIGITFKMPNESVEITGGFDSLSFEANALANTSKTYAYHGSVAITGGPQFIAGADVTCTITPDTNFNYPDSVDDIKFFSDSAGTTPLATTPQVTYSPGEATFTFKMPTSNVYVAAVCDTAFPSLVVTTNVTHETAPEFTSTTAGTTIEIIFSNIESGYRLPNDLNEFLSCHTVEVEGKYNELEWSKRETTGTLTIKSVFGNLVITGSPLPL